MGKKILFTVSLIFLSMGFSLTLDQIFARRNVSNYKIVTGSSVNNIKLLKLNRLTTKCHKDVEPHESSYTEADWEVFFFSSSQTSSNKEVVIESDQPSHGNMKPIQNFTIPITQALNYSLSRQAHLQKEPWNAFGHGCPVNVSKDGIPCVLFWAKRITIKFKNQTWLDVTEEAFGQKATVDASNSNCSEESAKLSLKFDDAENPKGLEIRFTLTNYNKFSRQSWFSLHQIEIIFNNSIQATFNATGVYAPSSYSYHCQRVSSLPRYDALLLPSTVDDGSRLWEVTFVDFQIQGFAIQGGRFAKARDCAPSFSPAILIGLAMSLILLLVLAYALHMLIYLRYLDRHYDFMPSPAHFPQLKARDAAEEKEPLRSQGAECYELRTQETRRMHV